MTLGNVLEKTKKELSNKDTADFIYVPSINLYVAKQKKSNLFFKDWVRCHKELQKNGERMLIISEFIEFLKYTKNNHPDIYNEITEVRNPWRGEWLDAEFKFKDKKLSLNSNHVFNSNGEGLGYKIELLNSDTLMKKKAPGIDLEDYIINNHTKQGLPNKKVKPGFFYYYPPNKDNLSVARFSANRDWVALNCGRYKSGTYPGLSVRACKNA